ncbi:GNAT family N-acetyltransferase [bacterium]|nr:GNAT family N-acetyltransferase [bacterium]
MIKFEQIRKYSDLNLLPESGYESDVEYQVSFSCGSEKTEFKVERRIKDKPNQKVWIRTDDERYRLTEIINYGLSYTLFSDNFPIGQFLLEKREWNNTMFIESIEIIKNERGKGYGSLLMNEIYRIAEENNYRIIALETQTKNGKAIDFYYKHGYRIEGIDISFYTNDDFANQEIAVFMKKRIV